MDVPRIDISSENPGHSEDDDSEYEKWQPILPDVITLDVHLIRYLQSIVEISLLRWRDVNSPLGKFTQRLDYTSIRNCGLRR